MGNVGRCETSSPLGDLIIDYATLLAFVKEVVNYDYWTFKNRQSQLRLFWVVLEIETVLSARMLLTTLGVSLKILVVTQRGVFVILAPPFQRNLLEGGSSILPNFRKLSVKGFREACFSPNGAY